MPLVEFVEGFLWCKGTQMILLFILREVDAWIGHHEMGCYNFGTILPIMVYHIKMSNLNWLLCIVLCDELIASSGEQHDSRE